VGSPTTHGHVSIAIGSRARPGRHRRSVAASTATASTGRPIPASTSQTAATVAPLVMTSSTTTTAGQLRGDHPECDNHPGTGDRRGTSDRCASRARSAAHSPAESARGSARTGRAVATHRPSRRSRRATARASLHMWSPRRCRAAFAVLGTGTSSTGRGAGAAARNTAARTSASDPARAWRPRSLYVRISSRSRPRYGPAAWHGGRPGGGGSGRTGCGVRAASAATQSPQISPAASRRHPAQVTGSSRSRRPDNNPGTALVNWGTARSLAGSRSPRHHPGDHCGQPVDNFRSAQK